MWTATRVGLASGVPLVRIVRIVRLLVGTSPRVYRELLALSLHQHRPEAEVMMSPPKFLDREMRHFMPHLVVHNEGIVPVTLVGLICQVELLFSDGMGARISLDGSTWDVEDLGTENLLEIVDRMAGLIPGEPVPEETGNRT